MKKNNNYFEMLKNEARINFDIFSNILNNTQNAVNRLDFKSAASELFEKLVDEFVPPIERTDIYILSSRLEEVFISLSGIECFCLSNSVNKDYLSQLSAVFSDTVQLVSQLYTFKSPKKLSELSRSLKRQILSSLTDVKRKQNVCSALCELAFLQALSELLHALLKTVFEIERIIINNN